MQKSGLESDAFLVILHAGILNVFNKLVIKIGRVKCHFWTGSAME